ncbi:hypothetical protein CIW48_24700 [Methylobacterium sp. P1-11]|uniref:hypothetical protein n=1 Tax=Methylobacterium sp. P1-11 TaxID=2024616 RepID=UPI0011EDF76D|nr:hypothetical protein [Methylobacterium sp. P1-11]KAA0121267.1 hypothetical protein CIW48_24700 [Methylobacterium sp. P1-11]
MDAPAQHQATPTQIIRDRGDLVLGRVIRQTSTGKLVFRDARGLVVGAFDEREVTTSNSRGLVIARGDVLAALLL